ncbi:MAG: GT4 family glycosyltransferase PelF [Lachnospiraceae bacterium]|nr:GT4 family glycosyltransferase PelF [Lachnospiraceae bacterium]
MKICMILEGSYPYVQGGVSSWMHQYIQAMPDTEFVLWCIAAEAKDRGKFKYQLPENVVGVKEVFLDDALRLLWRKKNSRQIQLSAEEKTEISKFFCGENFQWDVLFDIFQNKKINPVELLMSPTFLQLLIQICREKYPYISFAEYFHTMRSMLLPELYLLTTEIPKADLYHATATGYSGLLGSMGKWKNKKPFILTEHGIYTREREEELLGASWVLPYFKDQWIQLFYAFSQCAYSHADRVTALFSNASKTQAEIGCDTDKLTVIENGVHFERFSEITAKKENGFIDIGAVVRIAKIKDIKTMIYAFAEVKNAVSNARLFILGGVDDEEYFEECKSLISQLAIKDISFTGAVNVLEYMPGFDFTILTSISEGQPLSVLESFAAGRPCVTTDVGCCRELIMGKEEDTLGIAGLCVPPMHRELLASSIIQMCREKQNRLHMGEVGRERVRMYYTHENSMEKYRELYREVLSWQE